MINIETIKGYCKSEMLIITRHAAQRMNTRAILPSEVTEALLKGEIIEQYPDDSPFPSCLIYGRTRNGRPLHIVIADIWDFAEIVTVYVPDPEKFGDDLKTRRKK